MKRIIAVVSVIMMLVLALALPVGASTPYQTYTYSIAGTALYSPDAYIPSKTINSELMGLKGEEGIDTLAKFYPELNALCVKRDAAAQTLAVAEQAKAEAEAIYGKTHDNYFDARDAVNTAKTAYDNICKEITAYVGPQSTWSDLTDICGPCDVETDNEQNIYIADTENNRIVILDRYYKVKNILHSFLNDQGIEDGFSKPQGVYITADRVVSGQEEQGKIYVCDTVAGRIVTFDLDGNFMDIIPEPESELFTSTYRPVAVAVDNYNRLYVVSDMTYEGVIVMTEEGDFTGFVGAQKVTITAWEQIWRRFQSKEQRKLQKAFVPIPFNNITLTGDFIYATTSGIEESKVTAAITGKDKTGEFAPVKMLNAAGEEIMRRNGFYPPSGEVDYKQNNPMAEFKGGASIIKDVAVGPEKTWSIIDQKRSKVFTYDFDGNLLFAFGDFGRQLGNIGSMTEQSLSGVVYQGDKMLLLDKKVKNASFVVYDRTEYGDILIQALADQNARRNDQAINNWTEILKRNSNFDAAYIGIGNAKYRSGDYAEALEYYQAAYDTTNYSKAYQELRKEWMSKFILLIPVFVIVVCFACSKFLGYAKKVNKRVSVTKGKRTYGQELIYAFHLIFHPFDGFWDLKHEKRGSVRAGTTILGIVIVAFYYQAIGQGYIMNPQGEYSTIFGVILSVMVPLALWIISNWCLTTLFDGKGTMTEVYIATAYALAPYVLIQIPLFIFSNMVTNEEGALYTFFNALSIFWCVALLLVGLSQTHDYTMSKTVLSVVASVVGMIVIVVLCLLIFSMASEAVAYFTSFFQELIIRFY